MKPQGKLFYPSWVKPKSLIIGDISYRREDTSKQDWDKYIYTSSKWIPFDTASIDIKRTSERRRNAMIHFEETRKTGV